MNKKKHTAAIKIICKPQTFRETIPFNKAAKKT